MRTQALGERGGAVARRKGWQGAVAMAMAREGCPVRARRADTVWRLEKRDPSYLPDVGANCDHSGSSRIPRN